MTCAQFVADAVHRAGFTLRAVATTSDAAQGAANQMHAVSASSAHPSDSAANYNAPAAAADIVTSMQGAESVTDAETTAGVAARNAYNACKSRHISNDEPTGRNTDAHAPAQSDRSVSCRTVACCVAKPVRAAVVV